MKPMALLLLAALAARASGPSDPLDAPVPAFRAVRLPADAAFLAVGRACGLTLAPEPGLNAAVSLELKDGTVRQLLDALAATQGAFWERVGAVISIRRDVLRFYEIDYPQMTRTAQGSSTVVLAAQSAPLGNGSGAVGVNGGAAANAALAAANPAGIGNVTDQTNLSVQQQNQNTFWTDVLAELTGMAQPGEKVAVNKLAGIAMVTAPPARQEDYRAFIRLVNRRIGRQVRISARVLEVELSKQGALGVDWSAAAAKAGALSLSGLASATGWSSISGQALGAPTVSGTLAIGKVSALIQALAEQGSVRAVSNPSVLTLSNQTAFVKVGTEQTFFSLANSTTLNQPGVTTPFASTQNVYAQNAITIGTVLYVTPEVNSDDTVTVDVLPAITQLIGVDSSPDGQQTAPRMDIKALSTLARLHPGEAVLIGGLIHDETDRESRTIPGLGALPVVGKWFGTTSESRSRTELVIFLTAERVP